MFNKQLNTLKLKDIYLSKSDLCNKLIINIRNDISQFKITSTDYKSNRDHITVIGDRVRARIRKLEKLDQVQGKYWRNSYDQDLNVVKQKLKLLKWYCLENNMYATDSNRAKTEC